jgi:hypothetical protein
MPTKNWRSDKTMTHDQSESPLDEPRWISNNNRVFIRFGGLRRRLITPGTALPQTRCIIFVVNYINTRYRSSTFSTLVKTSCNIPRFAQRQVRLDRAVVRELTLGVGCRVGNHATHVDHGGSCHGHLLCASRVDLSPNAPAASHRCCIIGSSPKH